MSLGDDQLRTMLKVINLSEKRFKVDGVVSKFMMRPAKYLKLNEIIMKQD